MPRLPRKISLLPRKKRGPRSDSRLRVIEAAQRLFSQKGFSGTSVDEIASSAHASPSSIYWHFKGGKDDILLAVVEEAMRQQTGFVLDAVRRGKDIGEKFEIFIKAVQRHMQSGGETIRLIQQMALERSYQDPAVRERLRGIYKMCRGALAGEMAEYFPKLDYALIGKLAVLQMAVFDGLFLQWQLDPKEVDLDGIFELLLATGKLQLAQMTK